MIEVLISSGPDLAHCRRKLIKVWSKNAIKVIYSTLKSTDQIFYIGYISINSPTKKKKAYHSAFNCPLVFQMMQCKTKKGKTGQVTNPFDKRAFLFIS